MDFFADPLAQGFMRRALLAGTVMGGAGGLLGVFIVQRGLSFLSDGLAHATFGGMALGLLVGAGLDQAIWVALPFTILVAVAINAVRRRSRLGGDVATGVFFAFAFALGVLFLGLRPAKDSVNVEALLFGSILAISPEILLAMLLVAAVTVAALAFSWSR
ncbi:MAG TPA: metal ABC transporter permease, partial [Vicinamibacteria bacterium]|nr:metal ABC transporter permease [Vicinamibacteria bacterium]